MAEALALDPSGQTTNIDPWSFCHRADIANGTAQFVETTADKLRSAIFLDGREEFWQNPRVAPCDFSIEKPPVRPFFLFHFGFCGSTLLAKSLDRQGICLALKEPQCLTDIASQKPMLDEHNRNQELVSGLGYVLSELGNLPTEEVILIKLSNWVNGLLPTLSASADQGRAIFLSMDLRGWLRATFRGGRDRLVFCSRLASLLAHEIADGPLHLERAISQTDDSLGQAANIAAFVHEAQGALFNYAIKSGSWEKTMWCDYGDIVADPEAVITHAAEFLGLLSDVSATKDILASHAKDETQGFTQEGRMAQDSEVEQFHASRFDRAEEWIGTINLNVRQQV